MSWLHAIVYGVVQGLTEYLPVSSTGHVLLVGRLTGWGDPSVAFSAVIQLGTIAAVLVYFRGELLHLSRGLVATLRTRSMHDPEGRMAWLIGIGSLPILVVGFLVKDVVDSARNLIVVALALIVGGVALWIADRRGRGHLHVHDLTRSAAIILGLAQCLALIPGVSRSGATIVAGLLLGFHRVAATRFSFLLAIPAVVVSGLYELKDVGGSDVAWGPTLLGTGVSFIVGIAVIHWLLKYVATHTFRGFIWYRIVLGSAVLALVGAGLIAAS